MNQQLKLAIEARDLGVARVKEKNSDFVASARGVARMLARSRPDRTITSDDLRAHLEGRSDIARPTHFNAWGAIFSRNPDFKFHSYYTSTQKQGHGNRLIRWLLTTA